jgi:hypothetical protein
MDDVLKCVEEVMRDINTEEECDDFLF